MTSSRIGWELAVLVIVCVAATFFFPALHGSYTQVNGPVTALRSAQGAARLRVAIVRAAFNLIGKFQISLVAWLNSTANECIGPQVLVCADYSSILRC